MRLIILGAPGAGKGTQAVNLAKTHNVPHISTGDIFRSNIKNGTELGKKAKEYIDKGLLVPDDVTIGIVKDRLLQSDCEKGFILDGFPRTIEQAEKLDTILEDMNVKLDKVLNIHVPDDEIVKECLAEGFVQNVEQVTIQSISLQRKKIYVTIVSQMLYKEKMTKKKL